VLLRRGVELAPGEPAFGARGACLRVDADPLHAAQVDADTRVDHRGAGDSVPAAVHRERQGLLARKVDREHDVIGRGATGDQRGLAVDHAVEDGAGLVVSGIARMEQLAGEARQHECSSHASDRSDRASVRQRFEQLTSAEWTST
jgi:hypothetical protein